MLNAAEQQVDFLHVKRGNPQIEDSKMYVTTVAYNIFKGKINFQASGMHYYVDQSPLAYYSIGNGKLIQTFGNSDAHNVNINASKTASQTAYVKLAYTIDFGKKTSRDRNNVNRTIDSAILKAN